VIFNDKTTTSATNAQLIALTNPGPLDGVGIVGSDFVASAVPVPAAAWLFGSALLGLGVVRRKK